MSIACVFCYSCNFILFLPVFLLPPFLIDFLLPQVRDVASLYPSDPSSIPYLSPIYTVTQFVCVCRKLAKVKVIKKHTEKRKMWKNSFEHEKRRHICCIKIIEENCKTNKTHRLWQGKRRSKRRWKRRRESRQVEE